MDKGEKLLAAEEAKTRGTHFFQSNKYYLAVKQYKRVVDLLQFEKHYEGSFYTVLGENMGQGGEGGRKGAEIQSSEDV